jgi:hypothetical protein
VASSLIDQGGTLLRTSETTEVDESSISSELERCEKGLRAGGEEAGAFCLSEPGTRETVEQAVPKRMAAEGKDPFVVKPCWSFHDRELLFLVMDLHPGEIREPLKVRLQS